MKSLLVFVLTLAVVAALGGYEPGLRSTFGVGFNINVDYFFDIPRTLSDARAAGWKRSTRPKGGYLPDLVMLCPYSTDKLLCCMYDDTGYIAGLQVGVPKLQITNSTFDWEKRGFTSWYTAFDGVCKEFWTIQQYLVDEEFLQTSKEERIASRNSSILLQAGGVWLTGIDKKLTKVSTEVADIVDQGLFTEQQCIPLMGRHYFYNMTTTTECVDDQIYPWFLLTANDQLIGTGFLSFASVELDDDTLDRYEHPGSTAVRVIVPSGPECVYDLADDPGVTTMHLYYIDQPWTILFC